MTRTRCRLIPALCVILMLAGCSASTAPTTTITAVTTTTLSASTSTTAAAVDVLAAHLDWFMGVLNGGELTPEEYEIRFDASFREAVPFETSVVPIVTELQAAGPYEVVEIERRSPTGLDALISSADSTRYVVHLDLDAGDQIVGLLVQPAEIPSLENPPTNLDEAADRLAGFGEASMLAAEVVGNECVPIHAVEAERPVPLGSAFKLYVLGAVADAVAAGDLAWTDQVVITDELKSVPSGILQDQDDGSTTTVQEAAELMISISDNTATDLLINLLGRERVEQAQAIYGHSQPELNIPFLTTREWAAMKLGSGAEELRAAYLDADEAGRRAILSDLADVRADSLAVTAFVDPIEPDRLEWFGSLLDLCIVHLLLQERALQPSLEPVAEILSLNPGVPSDDWDYIAFKGGSEPGLLTASWLVMEGQRTFFLGATVLDREQPLEELEAVLVMAAARDLMGR
jgi:hypothetical protein